MAKSLRIILVALAFCLLIATLLFAACTLGEHVHFYGEWEETAPDCETAGQRTRKCTECGDVQTDTIEKLGHDWDNGTVTKQATCVDDGEITYVCKRDGNHFYTLSVDALGHDWQEVGIIIYPTCEDSGLRSAVCSRCDVRVDEQIIPPLDHDWKIETIETETCQHGAEYYYTCKRENCNASKTVTSEPIDHVWDSGKTVAATCESEGSVTYTCVFDCGTHKIDKIKAIGHSFGSWRTVNVATCTEQGSEKRSCTRSGCDKSETRITNSLGHSFSTSYTVDVAPTYDEEGSQSKHCTRSGCTETSDVQTISRLQATYTVTVKDPCGSVYYGNATVQFYVNGVLKEEVTIESNQVATVTLNSPSCNVKITGLNAGYYADDDGYDVSAEQPELTVCLGAAIPGDRTTWHQYHIGDILYNQQYVYYVGDNDTATISTKEILSSKKGILMNFYYDGCPPCNSEMAGLIEIANQYKDEVQVLMLNVKYESETLIKSFRSRNNAVDSPLYFLTETSNKSAFQDFIWKMKTAPWSAFIDCNGQLIYWQEGAMSKSAFQSAIKRYILDRYDVLHPSAAANDNSTTISNVTQVAIIPSKKFGF